MPHLHRFITPYLYYLFILWLPFATPRFWLLVIGFITGLSLDYFTQTPGLHAAACLLIAYIRPFVVNLLLPKDSTEFNYKEPSPRHTGVDTLWDICSDTYHFSSRIYAFPGMAILWKSANFSDQTCCHDRDKPFAHLCDRAFYSPRKMRYRTNTA